jgi:peptidoglycan/xylan/chitin deacetylase (PgdA/CDA1 family)
MRLFRPGFFAAWLYPEALLRMETSEEIICLTFDDGPDPESTPVLLKILKSFDIRAVFFCDGRAAEKYPSLVDKIIANRHLIGNHGYKHLDGWKTSADQYYDDINYGSQFTSDKLFRPPYGHLRLKQYRMLCKSFRIILWDINPYDFDESYGAGRSLSILNKRIRPGSIVVLHDKPSSSLITFLKDFLTMSIKRGYRFALPEYLEGIICRRTDFIFKFGMLFLNCYNFLNR